MSEYYLVNFYNWDTAQNNARSLTQKKLWQVVQAMVEEHGRNVSVRKTEGGEYDYIVIDTAYNRFTQR